LGTFIESKRELADRFTYFLKSKNLIAASRQFSEMILPSFGASNQLVLKCITADLLMITIQKIWYKKPTSYVKLKL